MPKITFLRDERYGEETVECDDFSYDLVSSTGKLLLKMYSTATSEKKLTSVFSDVLFFHVGRE